MKEKDQKELFDLQPLEQRVMLSADPVVGVLAAGVPDDMTDVLESIPEAPFIEEILHFDESSDQSPITGPAAYDPSDHMDDLFPGL